MSFAIPLRPWLVGLALARAAGMPTAAAQAPAPPPAELARTLAEVPVLGEARLSPDGQWVTWQVTRRSVAENTARAERWLQRLGADGAPSGQATRLPDGISAVGWCPDSRCLSYLQPGTDGAPPRLIRHDPASGTVAPVPFRDAGGPGRPPLDRIGADYRWSPRGTFLAFSGPLAEVGGLDPRRGVRPEEADRWRAIALFVVDVASGTVRQVTPDTLDLGRLGGFDWSPDEQSLVVTVDRERDSQSMNTDLVVVAVDGSSVRPLVSRPGMDNTPRWSPDGRWIAFASHYGTPNYQTGWPAVVSSSGGEVIEFPREGTPMGFRAGWWTADSRSFLYESSHGMTQVLARADPASRRAAALPAPAGALHLPHDAGRSMSADGRRMAFTRESLTAPAELAVAALGPDGRPTGPALPLTRLGADFPLGALVHTDTLSWRSPDGRFTIHALLLAPASAVRGGQVRGPLPTVVSFIGGPSMVSRSFAGDGFHGAQLALAARGYLVLVPNTRGRSGYGPAFLNAIADDRNRGRGPLGDAMAGVDLLIARGLADSTRLGVAGHSYGGYLTSYAVTQTHRFKAAVNHEGGPLSLTPYFWSPPIGWRNLISRDLYGVHDPFAPEEWRRLIEESPALQAGRIRTPMLLQYGAQAWATEHGRPLYHALQRLGVPSALFIYDEGHVFSRPAAIADDLLRTVEWLDYWVRGVPFPAERAGEYLGGR